VRAATLALPAALAIAVAPTHAQRRAYEAHGFEPPWHLTIDRGRIVFESGEGPRISVPAPRGVRAGNFHRYVTRRIIVRVTRRECEDEGERVYADTVAVQAHGLRFEGCGGAVVREPAD
jgi:uncharacterized membrane protein